MNIKVGREIEFKILNHNVKGIFVKTEGDLITVKVTETDYNWEKIGDLASINKKYLIKNKK